MRDLGGVSLLRTSSVAFQRANSGERARIAEVRDALTTATLEGSPLRTAGLAVSSAVPHSFAGFYTWEGGRLGRCGHSRGDGQSWSEVARSNLIPILAQYNPSKLGPWSNRLDDSRCWARTPIAVRTRRELWRANDWHGQLRFAFYDGRSFLGVLAVLSEHRGGFDDSDARVVEGIAAACAELLWVYRLIGDNIPCATLLSAALDALAEPVILVTGAGVVIYASRSGRDWIAPLRQVLALRPGTASGYAALRNVAHSAPIEVDGRTAFVVRPRASATPGQNSRIELPPALASVAELVVLGLSDKEIAERTSLSLTTVRTYVQRIYGRLGVRSRASLGRLWHRGA
jgi:hypothetical protein